MDELERLILAYQRRLAALRAQVGASVATLWVTVGGVSDEQQTRFASDAAKVSYAGQVTAANLTDGYLAAYQSMATGERIAPLGLNPDDVTGAAVRNGTDPLVVYSRMSVTARTALSQGKDVQEALAAAQARAEATAAMDIQLAHRAAAQQVMGSTKRIVGYRRVLTGNSCPICAIASTQRYRRGDLMPIHNRCDCGVAPIIGERDPGQIINRPLYESLTGKATTPAAAAVHMHGELGPVLSDAAHDFTGPGDIAA